MDPAQGEATTAWCRETFAAIQPFVGPRRYANYLGEDDAGDAALVAAYGPNLARLKQLKKKYDPDNLFHLNVNVRPG
jgi:FAD/FMN-containing dehydrogenase